MPEAVLVTSPYPGLRPFETYESDVFFGRENHTDRLLDILQRERFLMVIGPSGSGKSSLVRAGLLPSVRMGMLGTGSDWQIALLRPGDEPISRLARALLQPNVLGRGEPRSPAPDPNSEEFAFVAAELRRGPLGLVHATSKLRADQRAAPMAANLLVLVDQFEEVFTYAGAKGARETESEHFVNLLLTAQADYEARISIVLTMRTDFLGNCARFVDLAHALNRSLYFTPPLTRAEMERAIRGPAEVFNGTIDAALVTELINETNRSIDQLPLAQHALARMWAHAVARDGSAPRIGWSDAKEVGGLAGALEQHAESVLEDVLRVAGPAGLALVEGLFSAVTERRTGAAGGQDVRRPQSLARIASACGLGTAWQQFIPIVEAYSAPDVFLLQHGGRLNGESVIDLTHEALIRQWARLANWVAIESRRAAEYRRWVERASEFNEERAGLLDEVALKRATEWLQPKPGDRTWQPTAAWAARYGSDSEFTETVAFIQASAHGQEEARAAVVRRRRQAEDAAREALRATRLAEPEGDTLPTPHVFVAIATGTKQIRGASIDFDLLYSTLIAPALQKAGCIPFRADQEEGAGDIRTDMFFELVAGDLVVADTSLLDANVYYQLGVRHGATPRGVFMIHGGWDKPPFDIASDRRFEYNGKLFLPETIAAQGTWQGRVEAEAERLGQVLRRAFEVDNQSIGSPVYKEVVGLKPVDWSSVKTARAQYFGDVFVDWKARVDAAKLNGWPGDILTLADDAPTRFHRGKLLWHAADALCSMHRFEAALPVIEDLLRVDPKNREALTRKGLVLARLGRLSEAKVHMLQVADDFKDDTEASGILGRVFKDLWRLEWKDGATLQERQSLAVTTSNYIASAVNIYDKAARRKFDFYTGINVVSFVKLLAHLKTVTGEEPADCEVDDVDTLASVVRFAAKNTLDSAGLTAGQDGVWAAATLGELELVMGNGDKARALYRDAANAAETSYFNVSSMLDQVHLFESLGFQLDGVAAVKKVLEQRRSALENRIGGLKKSAPRFAKVAIASGHMIDKPDRKEERFPARKEGVVRDQIAAQLAAWNIGKGDLAICGAARGADLLFAEVCAERGAEVWLMLPLPENDFLEESVRLPDSNWEDRYFELSRRDGVKTFSQLDRLKAAPKGASVFARNNLWIVNSARVEIKDPKNLYALLVWDEKPAGDGPGGTADCATRVKRLGGRTKIINPTKL